MANQGQALPDAALLKLAEGLDKLANSIEEEAKAAATKVASDPSPIEYGSLGQDTTTVGDAGYIRWLFS